jgi:nucleotide-binding universal stress UspA family protein
MANPKAIVVGVDFSDAGERALGVAIGLAQRAQAKLFLFHALEIPLPLFEPYAVSLPADFVGEARKSAQEKLAKAEERARAAGLTVSSRLGEMPAAASVSDYAREVGADWIVVGTHGYTGLKHVLLGSVAERTVKESPCSVLVVRQAGSPLAPKQIVAATDFSAHGTAAVQAAADLARAHGAKLHIVHAADLRVPFVTPYEVAVPDALITAAYDEARRQLGLLVDSLPGVTVTTELVTAPPHAAIDDAAKRLAADLVVTGSRGRSGLAHAVLGSVAERTVRHAPCSVLIVKGPKG